jgi:hypothetical protein
MSFFKTRCPDCGEEYWTGVVGMTLMGSHECPLANPEPEIPAEGPEAVPDAIREGYRQVREG